MGLGSGEMNRMKVQRIKWMGREDRGGKDRMGRNINGGSSRFESSSRFKEYPRTHVFRRQKSDEEQPALKLQEPLGN